MPEAKREEVIVGKDGTIRAVYSPVTAKLAQAFGTPEVRRASHVEPTAELTRTAAYVWVSNHCPQPDQGRLSGPELRMLLPEGWWADMTPVGGPVLGPYDTREEALDDEKTWLLEHHIPTATTPVESA